MALYHVLKEFGENAGRKIPLTSTQILWWTLEISETDYCK